jgi:hypothetical protein
VKTSLAYKSNPNTSETLKNGRTCAIVSVPEDELHNVCCDACLKIEDDHIQQFL